MSTFASFYILLYYSLLSTLYRHVRDTFKSMYKVKVKYTFKKYLKVQN